MNRIYAFLLTVLMLCVTGIVIAFAATGRTDMAMQVLEGIVPIITAVMGFLFMRFVLWRDR